MKATFFDRQDAHNALNGTVLEHESQAKRLLGKLGLSRSHFCELLGENGYNLLLGVSRDLSCAQYSLSNGMPSYFMAVRPDRLHPVQGHQFLSGGTATPIRGEFCLPLSLGIQIAVDFVRSGQRSSAVRWQEI